MATTKTRPAKAAPAKAAPSKGRAAAPAPKPTHRSVTRERAKELGKERLGPFYVGDWVGPAMAELAERTGDASRNALLERLVRAEAERLGVRVPTK
jgi:hypothetical protein